MTLSLERRRRLVELARMREILVVEDNPYGLLRYEGEPQAPLYQLDGGDYVIYVGTLSKILSPGIRLGWAVAPPPVMEKIVLGKQATDLCTSTLSQYFALEYFAEDRWRDYVDSLCGIYRSRRDAMLEQCAGLPLVRADGGWSMLLDCGRLGIDPAELSNRLIDHKVAATPMAAWGAEVAARQLRLVFSNESVERLGTLGERLRAALESG